MTLKIVCISDTHNLHQNIVVPDGDILLHAGDATMRGRIHEIENFLAWFDALPHKTKVFVPGNHDFAFDSHRSDVTLSPYKLSERFPTVQILRDKVLKVDGITITGTPWVAGLQQWAFGWKSYEGRKAEFAAIPPETNILVTHGPAYGTLDTVCGMRLGDEALTERLRDLPNLKLHVHGHIHDSYGIVERSAGYVVVNAAICNEQYSPVNKPIVLDYEVGSDYEQQHSTGPVQDLRC